MSLFTDPDYPMSPALYSKLVDMGFRRSGEHVYRPYCNLCKACMPSRLDVYKFRMSRSQKRTFNKNQDLDINRFPPTFNTERFKLYRRYVSQRHTGGDMDIPEPSRYQSFISSSWCKTVFYEYRLGEKLLAVSVVDILSNGLSAFYTFFDPDYRERGLGTYSVLWLIEEAKRLELRWIYLGYWIEHCTKMEYKSKFKPLEVFSNQRWERLDTLTGKTAQKQTEPLYDDILEEA